MQITLLKCKIHRATVTDADLNYEGSISIDPALVDCAAFANSKRLRSTIVITVSVCNLRYLRQVRRNCLNGAAARLVHRGDLVIIAAYASMSEEEAAKHKHV